MSYRPSDEPYDEAIANMVDVLNSGIDPTGCWSDYNKKYRHWRYLQGLSKVNHNYMFYRPEDLPTDPDVDDFSNNDC